MSYSYQVQRPNLFSEKGQIMFLKIRDFANKALEHSGAVRMDCLMDAAPSGDTWDMMACVDRMVELGELVEVSGSDSCGQYRIFTRYPN